MTKSSTYNFSVESQQTIAGHRVGAAKMAVPFVGRLSVAAQFAVVPFRVWIVAPHGLANPVIGVSIVSIIGLFELPGHRFLRVNGRARFDLILRQLLGDCFHGGVNPIREYGEIKTFLPVNQFPVLATRYRIAQCRSSK